MSSEVETKPPTTQADEIDWENIFAEIVQFLSPATSRFLLLITTLFVATWHKCSIDGVRRANREQATRIAAMQGDIKERKKEYGAVIKYTEKLRAANKEMQEIITQLETRIAQLEDTSADTEDAAPPLETQRAAIQNNAYHRMKAIKSHGVTGRIHDKLTEEGFSEIELSNDLQFELTHKIGNISGELHCTIAPEGASNDTIEAIGLWSPSDSAWISTTAAMDAELQAACVAAHAKFISLIPDDAVTYP